MLYFKVPPFTIPLCIMSHTLEVTCLPKVQRQLKSYFKKGGAVKSVKWNWWNSDRCGWLQTYWHHFKELETWPSVHIALGALSYPNNKTTQKSKLQPAIASRKRQGNIVQ